MEILALAKDFILGLAWPSVILLLALIFRDDIRKAMPRLKKAGLSGIELDQQALSTTRTFAETGELKPYQSIQRSNLMVLIETSILKSLETYKEEDHIHLLVHEVAIARIGRMCESIWDNIFTSQIQALALLRRNGGTASASELESVYGAVDPAYPAEFGYDRWLNYLFANNLVAQTDGTISLTDLGSDFLDFVPSKAHLQRLP